MIKKWCNPYGKSFGLLVIRLGLGVIFALHGYEKLSHLEQISGFFSSLGLGMFWVYLVSLVEFLGGIAMILGVFTWLFGGLLSVVMLFAIFMVKWKLIPTMGISIIEIDVMLLCASLGLAMAGPGSFSVARFLGKRCHCESVCEMNNCTCKEGECGPCDRNKKEKAM